MQIGRINRDVAADLLLARLGSKRSAWNAADIRGEAERLIASVGVVAERATRHELVEDIADRARTRCVPLLDRGDVPEHIRSLTSERPGRRSRPGRHLRCARLATGDRRSPAPRHQQRRSGAPRPGATTRRRGPRR
ncbi:hypothetical protein [Nocardioides sp. B-3]|uniref:hypothetical protein n=1 Tax=Nocardioides sp. B-3 TaxID=2895565 RepID=UPI0021525DB5|nr:hypothetical protein [Nocardioides sp. B-3]UUZ60962.1 hypothetical protein LP418_09875 [Nocardioides sp. B-3]